MSFDLEDAIYISSELCNNNHIYVTTSNSSSFARSIFQGFSEVRLSEGPLHLVSTYLPNRVRASEIIQKLPNDEKKLLKSRLQDVLRQHGERNFKNISSNSSLRNDIIQTIRDFLQHLGFHITNSSDSGV